MNRRDLIRQILSGISIAVLPYSTAAKHPGSNIHPYLLASEVLLKSWCEGLMAARVEAPGNLESHGGLYSAAEDQILGRCADAAYPMLWYAYRYGLEEYVDAAIGVSEWADRNLSEADGAWRNGFKDPWKGITVFSALARAEAVKHYSSLLPPAILDQWLTRLRAAAKWLQENITIDFGNINYPASNTLAMILLGEVLQDSKLIAHGRELAQETLAWFSESNLIFGEGRRNKQFPDNLSKRGCRPIDIAYNVEESLPALAQYSLLTLDEKVLSTVVESMRAHLEFMLPDGGWDNSWGTRNFKWTWWGSRTSDGCQPAYALLADRDPRFLEAAWRNTELLKRCTFNGILYGGPHMYERNIRPSLHHTFCHAKALATVCNAAIPVVDSERKALPCDADRHIVSFPEVATTIIKFGNWRATLSAYDFPYKNWQATHASGGALTLLNHDRLGPLIVASMPRYQLVEKFDMQSETDHPSVSLIPRIEFHVPDDNIKSRVKRIFGQKQKFTTFSNIYDHAASIKRIDELDMPVFQVDARFVDERQRPPPTRSNRVVCTYKFSHDKVWITIEQEDDEESYFVFPLVASIDAKVTRLTKRIISLRKSANQIIISASNAIENQLPLNDRIYNHVPGFSAVELTVPFRRSVNILISAL